MECLFLKSWLDPLVEEARCGYLDSDPVGVVRELTRPADIEVAGLFAAALALGRVATIRQKTREIIDRLDGEPARVLAEGEESAGSQSATGSRSTTDPQPSTAHHRADLARRLKGFRHRFFGDADVLVLAVNIGRLLKEHGSLAAAWHRGLSLEDAADRFAADLSAPVRVGERLVRPEARLPLVPAPGAGSTCKRLAMYLRWMVRPDDGVDFGLWNHLSPADLVMPLDTHVFRIARLLGLTSARTPSWKVARGVTDALRACDPADPVKYDFALSRIGIVHGCRGRWHADVCPGCRLRPVCAAARVM